MAIKIRDRIKELRRVKASELLPHPKNWRIHPEEQRNALAAVLKEIGYAGAVLARETPEGLQLIDGHLRADLDPKQSIPVLITDLSDDEVDKLLAVLDPLSGMATADANLLDNLLQQIQTENKEFQDLLDSVAKSNGLGEVDRDFELRDIDPIAPPKMVWVLLGIPAAEYGEIAETIEAIGMGKDRICEINANG